MNDHGIDVEAVTTQAKAVTLYSISPFEYPGLYGDFYVNAITADGASVRIDVEEAKRVRRTANKKDTG